VLIAIPLILSAFSHIWNPIGFPSMYIDESHYMRRAMQVLEGMSPQESRSVYAYPYDHPYFGQLFLASVLKLIGYPSIVLDQFNPTASPSSSAIDKTNSSTADTSNSSNNSSNIQHSIEMLYLIPRMLMGILAVIDTFLVYKISERYYNKNRNVAFIASVLFAVMPMTWLLRRILLDSILLPFLLSSILFAICSNNSNGNNTRNYSKAVSGNNKEILTILVSGIFLGLAIFTKIPAFTMIPVVAFLLISNSRKSNNGNHEKSSKRRLALFDFNKKNVKMLGLWFIPVILIPSIWPLYSIAIGQFNLWIEGISYQTARENEDHALIESIDIIFGIDPILLIVGIVGIGFSAAVKRDFIFLLWVVPFVVFFASIALVQYFYWILVLPAFCIAAARLIEYISNKITHAATSTTVIINSRIKERRGGLGREGGGYYIDNRDSRSRINDNNNDVIINNNNNRKKTNNGSQRLLLAVLPFTIVSGIGIFGLVSTALLVTTNVNGQYFNIYSFIVQHLPEDINTISTTTNAATKLVTDAIEDTNNDNKVTVLSSHWWIWNFFWTSKYIFHKDFYFIDPHFDPHYRSPIKTEKILFIADRPLKRIITRNLVLHVSLGNNNNTDYSAPVQLLYGESDKIGTFKDSVIPNYNNTIYPFSGIPNMILGENRGVGRIEMRANY
jgi:hypothetical protein